MASARLLSRSLSSLATAFTHRSFGYSTTKKPQFHGLTNTVHPRLSEPRLSDILVIRTQNFTSHIYKSYMGHGDCNVAFSNCQSNAECRKCIDY